MTREQGSKLEVRRFGAILALAAVSLAIALVPTNHRISRLRTTPDAEQPDQSGMWPVRVFCGQHSDGRFVALDFDDIPKFFGDIWQVDYVIVWNPPPGIIEDALFARYAPRPGMLPIRPWDWPMHPELLACIAPKLEQIASNHEHDPARRPLPSLVRERIRSVGKRMLEPPFGLSGQPIPGREVRVPRSHANGRSSNQIRIDWNSWSR